MPSQTVPVDSRSPDGERQRPSRPPAGRGEVFRLALARATAAARVPYGYTLGVWGTATGVVGAHGVPQQLQVFVFVLGAVGAFLTLTTVTGGALGRREPDDLDPVVGPRPTLALLSLAAPMGAIATATLVAERLSATIAWAVAGWLGTSVYFATAACTAALSTRAAPGDHGEPLR